MSPPEIRSLAPSAAITRPPSRSPVPPARALSLGAARPRAHRLTAGDRPEDLELQPVRVLGVERQAHAVIGLADERAGLGQPLARAHEVGELADLPRGVVHARHALVGPRDTGLLEKTKVMIVGGAGDPEEGRVGMPHLHLEPEHLGVEAHAALDIGHPQDEMLQAPETDAGRRRGHDGYSALTVSDTQAMMPSPPGTRRPPATGLIVTSP